MQTTEVRSDLQFIGSPEDQAVAAEAFQVISALGRFYARTAPIRASLESLAGYFASRHKERPASEWSVELDRVLSANPSVFLREETDSGVLFVTTRGGTPPIPATPADQTHSLPSRFTEPVPIPEPPPVTRRRAKAIAPVPEPSVVTVPEIEPEVVAEQPVEVTPEPVEVAPPEPVVAEEVLDLSEVEPAAIGDVLAAQLRLDPTVANFGDLWMVEDKVPRLSRGELRRIREYLLERGEPLADDLLVQDVMGVRQSSDSYDLTRYALNYRLSREHREFEYVGSPDRRLWSTNGLPVIGTTKRKASEIGTDYRYLLDHQPEEFDRSEPVVDHVLTFYEYQLGVLPLSPEFAALFPAPMLPDQRAAVLVMESPQTYETFFVELRYPTANRGGYVAGFESFFAENVVPGALITLERTENNGKYLLEYLPISGQERKLLHLDEKKGRYVFRPTMFYCAIQDNMLLSENRFPRLANEKPLDDRTRRRPEQVLTWAFERIGEREGSGEAERYMAILDDLFAVINVERPISVEALRDIILSPEHPEFSQDPELEDVFYYQPVSE